MTDKYDRCLGCGGSGSVATFSEPLPEQSHLDECGRCYGSGWIDRKDLGYKVNDERTVPISVLIRHRDDLRSMAAEIIRNDNHLPIGSRLGIARSARADAYADIANRIERDIKQITHGAAVGGPCSHCGHFRGAHLSTGCDVEIHQLEYGRDPGDDTRQCECDRFGATND